MTTKIPSPSEWWLAPDPYDGLDWQAPMLGPAPASQILQDGPTEPTTVARCDDAGFVVERLPAPVYRCATCNCATTRRVVIAVTHVAQRGAEMVFAGSYRAQCARCAVIAAGLSERPTALAQPEPPLPWETKP